MIGRVADRFPFIEVVFFDNASTMISFMESESLSDVVLISLDHDLELIRGENSALIDPGTGDDVAQWLAKQPRPISPIIVHTTNGVADRILDQSHVRQIDKTKLLNFSLWWFSVELEATLPPAGPQEKNPSSGRSAA